MTSLSLRCGLIVAGLVSFTSVSLADTYDHSGNNGSLTDGQWLDQTISPPNVYGNPGAGDDAYFYASTITASGGSVHLLSGGNLQLSGMVTATNAGSLNLSGDGTLNVQSIVTDANGFGPILDVAGAHVNAHNGDGVANVTAGGTVTDATCSGTNGCGFFDGGSSLTITGLGGPGRAILAHASTLTANGGLHNFVLQIQSGSTAHVSTVTNSLAVVDGAGSLLTVTGNFSLNPQSLMITNGGAVTVSGNLTQAEGGPAFVTGSHSALTVGQDFLQNTGSDTDIRISAGATVRVQRDLVETRGQVSLEGSGSTLTVERDFSGHAGFVDLSAGASLATNGQLILDGGMDLDGDVIGGGGHWQGAGTTINSNGVMFLGNQTGTFSLGIDNGATVRTATALIGRLQGSSGIVGLSGAGTHWEAQAGGLVVGRTGSGKFDISAGAHLLLDSGSVFGIGLDAGSNGRVTVDGNGSVIDATGALVTLGQASGSVGSLVLTNQGSLLLGHNTYIGDAGSGNMSISSGGKVTVSGAVTRFGVGNQAGSGGSVSVQGMDSSLTVAGPVIIGVSGNGFLGAGQGAQITLNNSIGLKVGGLAGATGSVVLDGERTSLTTQYLGVGDSGTGQATISNGAELNATGARVDVGAAAGSDGSILVTGTNSLLSAGTNFPMTIGGGGKGSVVAAAGAQVYSTTGIDVAVRKNSTGSISVSGAGTLFDAPSIAFGDLPIPGFPTDGGAGTVTVQNSGQLRARSSLSIRASTANPSVIINGGQIAVGTGAYGPAGSLRVSQGGFLSGNPKAIQGQVIIGSGGTMSPGNSPGTFTINGSYEQDAGSTYIAEIGGTAAGSYDQINVTGAATLGGALSVRLVNGFTPPIGQTFRIVKAGSVHGAFASISEPSQAGIALTSDATGITVKVTSVVAGAPVISSATTAHGGPGTPFSYQIAATNHPISFGAMTLPTGLSVNKTTGLISGTPTKTGTFIVPIAANNAAGSGQADLTINIDTSSGAGVTPPLASRLLNVSTRLRVQSGENALIGGFIVTGTVPKKVIVRGIGPSLTAAGVAGALADPVLELHEPNNVVVTNDNWKQTQQAVIQATGIPPTNDLESAIVATLAPGNYTAILRGKNNGVGVGLVEAYDLDPTSGAQLGNISTRGFVDTGEKVMIGGIIVGPTGAPSGKMLVRAIGPSLAGFGVHNPLLDPTLELHNGNGAIISSNDNWKSTQQAAIQATGIPPTNDKEAAILATLAPGSYTAIVRGKSNTTGVGLVEVYNLP